MDITNADYVRAFALTTFAGLSTGLGGLVVYREKPLNQHILSFSLGLSAGVMIYISFVEMLSQSFDTLSSIYGRRGDLYTVIAFFVGMFISMFIDFLIPENENPHEMHGVEEISYDPHTNKKSTVKEKEGQINKPLDAELARVGKVSAIAIIVHNFPEGIASFVAALADPQLGFSIAFAIAIHNIPEGIAVAVPLYAGTGDKKRSFLAALRSGLAEPLGALLGFVVFRAWINDVLLGIIFAAIAGIMVFISFDELLPSAEKQGEHHIAIAGLMTGMAIMAISLIVI